jgi:hypothetical protein
MRRAGVFMRPGFFTPPSQKKKGRAKRPAPKHKHEGKLLPISHIVNRNYFTQQPRHGRKDVTPIKHCPPLGVMDDVTIVILPVWMKVNLFEQLVQYIAGLNLRIVFDIEKLRLQFNITLR